jgi:fused signal recognition particle receptor
MGFFKFFKKKSKKKKEILLETEGEKTSIPVKQEDYNTSSNQEEEKSPAETTEEREHVAPEKPQEAPPEKQVMGFFKFFKKKAKKKKEEILLETEGEETSIPIKQEDDGTSSNQEEEKAPFAETTEERDDVAPEKPQEAPPEKQEEGHLTNQQEEGPIVLEQDDNEPTSSKTGEQISPTEATEEVQERDTLPKKKKKSQKKSFWGRLKGIFSSRSKIDSNLIDELEELLITTDMGAKTVDKLIKKLEKSRHSLNLEKAVAILKEEIVALLVIDNKLEEHFEEFEVATPDFVPHIILMVGVNGAGKTTTIGKLAHQLASEGKKVIIGAADTFRAAAVEQLKVWGERINVPVISQDMNTRPSAVVFDAVDQAIKERCDVLLIDTAGRLHNKEGLMNELGKIKRIIRKKCPAAPQEILLVLDGSTGQNAWQQAMIFHEVLHVTGLIITKLDGTAKGGVVVGISEELRIPVKHIGVGEKVDDLIPFDPHAFVEHFFDAAT